MQVTINHLKSIRACILDPGVIELVSSCEEQMNMHYQVNSLSSFVLNDYYFGMI